MMVMFNGAEDKHAALLPIPYLECLGLSVYQCLMPQSNEVLWRSYTSAGVARIRCGSYNILYNNIELL